MDIKDTVFSSNTKTDWIKYFIEHHKCDGSHHKQELLCDIYRICIGDKIKVKEVSWEDGQKEYRVHLVDNEETLNIFELFELNE